MAKFLNLLALVFFANSVFARSLSPDYEKAQFKVGGRKIQAYIADTPVKRSEGLMFIKSLAADEGMLFVFDHEETLAFWMKNTLIPLSIGFFNASAVLVDVKEMKVLESMMLKEAPSYQSRVPAVFALEMNAGWFTKHGIKPGAKLEQISSSRSSLLKAKLGAPKSSRH